MSYTTQDVTENRTIKPQETLRNARRERENMHHLERDITELGEMFIEMDSLVKGVKKFMSSKCR